MHVLYELVTCYAQIPLEKTAPIQLRKNRYAFSLKDGLSVFFPNLSANLTRDITSYKPCLAYGTTAGSKSITP